MIPVLLNENFDSSNNSFLFFMMAMKKNAYRGITNPPIPKQTSRRLAALQYCKNMGNNKWYGRKITLVIFDFFWVDVDHRGLQRKVLALESLWPGALAPQVRSSSSSFLEQPKSQFPQRQSYSSPVYVFYRLLRSSSSFSWTISP